MSSFDILGDISLTKGEAPKSQRSNIRSLKYDYDDIVGEVKLNGSFSNDPQTWILNAAQSHILPNKWTFVFYRTDMERLGLKEGKHMTCYVALVDNLVTLESNKGVSIHWWADEIDDIQAPEPELDSTTALLPSMAGLVFFSILTATV